MNRFLYAATLMLAVLLGGATASVASGDGVPLPNPAKAFKGQQCIEPVGDMRRLHGEYLTHQRDETLRKGIRGKKYSLRQCIACHATTSPDVKNGTVRTIQPFCKKCHDYAAVAIDCFACHTGTAEDDVKVKTGSAYPQIPAHGKRKPWSKDPPSTVALLDKLKAELDKGNPSP